MENTNKRKGISLIVLVITILVMIILAGVVVVSLQKNNPIEKAKEAEFKTSVTSFLDELNLYHTQMLSNNQGSYEQNRINANKDNIVYIGSGQIDTNGNIKNLIPSMTGKYLDILEVQSGKLIYTGSNTNEIKWSTELGISIQSFVGGVNSPKLNEGMIPVYFDSSKNVWKKTDTSNIANIWYNYDEMKWANAVTVEPDKREIYKKAGIGTDINMEDINGFFVWIPRYAYSIDGTIYKKISTNTNNKINVKFLKGTSNRDEKGNEYPKDYDSSSINNGNSTPYIVHPAFKFGEKELTGIWVAKFEMSGSMSSNGRYPGNRYKNESTGLIEKELKQETTYMKFIPGVPTIRDENIDDLFSLARTVTEKNKDKYGLPKEADAHMIKNTEWGAVSYLAASKYGVIPEKNSIGKWIEKDNVNQGTHVDIIAGTDDYVKNVNTSTTNNVYGVYDLNGGSYEFVAAYINTNDTLNNTGKSLETAEKKYVDVYEGAKEVKENRIVVDGSFITQQQLNDGPIQYNSIRKRLVKETYNNLSKIKGDGVYETIQENNFSYLGKNTVDDRLKWLSIATDQSEALTNWDNDYTLISIISYNTFLRGGVYSNGNASGVFNVFADTGVRWTSATSRICLI